MRSISKSLLIVILLASLLISCQSPSSLYEWRGYDDALYNYSQKRDEISKEKLIRVYEQIIANPGGTTQRVPPGVFADYGFLLLSSGNKTKGLEMLQKEIVLYPESKVFIDRIIKRAENEK